jgi:hypothetical protein
MKKPKLCGSQILDAVETRQLRYLAPSHGMWANVISFYSISFSLFLLDPFFFFNIFEFLVVVVRGRSGSKDTRIWPPIELLWSSHFAEAGHRGNNNKQDYGTRRRVCTLCVWLLSHSFRAFFFLFSCDKRDHNVLA